jgi:hypothetical protein
VASQRDLDSFFIAPGIAMPGFHIPCLRHWNLLPALLYPRLQNASIPVTLWPMISVWMSCVPS